MKWKIFIVALLICAEQQAFSQSAKIDSVIDVLKGAWRWDYLRGGLGASPPYPAPYTTHVIFSQDGQDSINQTMTYSRYRGYALEKTARTTISLEYFNGYYDVFNFLPNVFRYFVNDSSLSDFWFMNDTLEMTWSGGDISTCGFLKDSFSLDPLDTIIGQLNGCWKWDHYFGGFAGLPPTPANYHAQVEFFQDVQDSANHTVSCRSYKDSVLEFTGRCTVTSDSLVGFNTLSCPLFDSLGIVGSPPIYFNFENDTLLFPQQQFVDGFVYAFLQNCDDTTTQTEYPDETMLSIYPNPASERVVIHLKNTQLQQLNLSNAVGQKLVTLDLINQSELTLDLGKFPEGVYFINIITQHGLLTKKIVIER